MHRSRPYRLTALLLAVALVTTSFGSVVAHACGHHDRESAMHESMSHEGMSHHGMSHADIAHAEMSHAETPHAEMSAAMTHEGTHRAASKDADHACCGDDCPVRNAASDPVQATCCSPSPAAAAEAVAPPPAPRTHAAVAPAPPLPPGAAPALRPPRAPFDTGPPPLPVRSHLSLSVLLI